MLKQKDIKKINEISQEFFKRFGLNIEIKSITHEGDTVFINLKSDDPQILIGERGQTLTEIQHLLRAILRKNIKEHFFIDVDVLDYKKKKKAYLRELAKSIADDVSLTKKEKVLPPMPAYDRRVIHLELAERSDVTTESIGKEPERRIVIRPYP